MRISFLRSLWLTLLASPLLAACSPSSIDQAYFDGGISPNFPGGYTRSIFSSHNF